MAGITDLQQMLATLEPSVRDGEFVYVTRATAPGDGAGEAGISCNVLAGFHHDHLLVPHDRTAEAVEVLRGLSGRSPRSPA